MEAASMTNTPSPIPATDRPAAAVTTIVPEETTAPSVEPTGTPGTATITPPPPTVDSGLPADHYVMERPIPTGWTDYGDRTYPYGGTSGGQYRPHTGMEFRNPESTPVIAVATSTVEYAGTDTEILFGPQANFYGNLIVLRLDGTTQNGQPVFALYGHLSEIYVTTGQTVPAREIIGAVGGTGVANGGAHLHFEVRLGDPRNYNLSTRNPDLWIRPYYGYGTLAGRVALLDGSLLREVALTVKGADMVRYTWTYAGSENISDEAWQENFTLGDLPEGWYTITTRSSRRTYSVDIYIQPNRTTWLELVFD